MSLVIIGMKPPFHFAVGAVLSLAGVVFLCWLCWRALRRSHEPAALLFKGVLTAALLTGEVSLARWIVKGLHAGEPAANLVPALVLVGSIAVCCIVVGLLWTSQISSVLISPLTSMFDGGNIPLEAKPLYSTAQSKRKFNKPLEAVIAIREQLAKFPNDFEGIMLLAVIQAEDLKDLASAEMTLNHFCEWDKAPPKQVAAALTQLADWQLKFSQDAYSAARALQRILEKYPDTEMALIARQRIAHLEGTEKMLLAAQDRRPVAVPEGVQNVGLLESSVHLVPGEIPPGELAAAYVKQLETHPDDTEAREKLAVLYAKHFNRLDLATSELEQMIAQTKYPPRRTAHWLNLLADLQIRGGAGYDAARATLEKIVERFPDFAVAEIARTRLATLKLEFKAMEKTSAKTMGVYEQNVGLKGNRHY